MNARHVRAHRDSRRDDGRRGATSERDEAPPVAAEMSPVTDSPAEAFEVELPSEADSHESPPQVGPGGDRDLFTPPPPPPRSPFVHFCGAVALEVGRPSGAVAPAAPDGSSKVDAHWNSPPALAATAPGHRSSPSSPRELWDLDNIDAVLCTHKPFVHGPYLQMNSERPNSFHSSVRATFHAHYSIRCLRDDSFSARRGDSERGRRRDRRSQSGSGA